MPFPLFRRLAAVVAFFVLCTAPLSAQEPWDRPAFASDPKDLIAAAEKVNAGDKGLIDLLDEVTVSFDPTGRTTTTSRLLYRIIEESAVEWNDEVSTEWSPWYEERPVIHARVVTKSGTVHMLDASTITEAPGDEAADMFTDTRVLRAPLPAIEVGAVVEWVITTRGNAPIEGAGTSSLFTFGRWVPVHRARLVLSGPASIEPRIVNKSDVKPVVEEKDGIRITRFERSDIPAFETDREQYLPFDETTYPYVAFSTGKSWQEVAAKYAQIVDRQIAGSDLQKLVRGAIGNATDRREIAARLLAEVQKNVRYAGVEIAEGSIVPRPPSTVLKNKYGDCKDKSTLLVAMLRTAGIPAEVALLRSGTDLDVHPELPGLGRFNHVIVRIGGDDPIWIDPTDEFARAGELPVLDQGRLVLIASAETTALTRTPEMPSSANRYHETRLVTLPENGRARVVETIGASWAQESAQRRWIATTDAKDLRESLESYVKSYYFAKALDKYDASEPHDLEKPFRVTLEATESQSGIVEDGEAAVAMQPSALLDTIPEVLHDWTEPKPDDDPKNAHKKRVHDFVFPAPRVKEWTYRIIPPPGYTARPLPKNETRKLGTTTYTTELSQQPDGTVMAVLRFDSGKRRISATEFEETRVALSKLKAEPQSTIGFDLTGQSKLNAGDVAGALEEFRKLVSLHPKEAQHHLEIARALLAGGLGEAARAEARKAVAIEPKHARAHAQLSFVLQHDLLGRQFRNGADIPAAIAELHKAKELDGTNLQHRVALARLLSYGDDSIRFIGRKARLGESIDEFRAIGKDFGDDAHAYDGELMLVLAYAGRFAELKELADASTNESSRNVGRILAAVAMEGIAAGNRELAAFDLDKRRAYAAEVGQHLLALRKYAECAAMMEIASQGAPNASQASQAIDMFKKARRLEDLPISDDDPKSILTRMFLAVAHADEAAADALLAADVLERQKKEKKDDDASFLSAFAGRDTQGMSVPVLMDIIQPMLQVQKDGSEENGYRLRLMMPMGKDASFSLYVTREGGRFAIRAGGEDESLGYAALHFLEQTQLDRARIWLNWAREEVDLGGGDDPLKGSPFAAVWSKARSTATADEIRLAALMQIAEHKPDTTSKLEELREKANDATKTAIDRALAGAYLKAQQWEKALAPARRLVEQYPDSEIGFAALTSALSFTGKTAESETLAKQRLERMPKDRAALRALSKNAAAARDYSAAATYAEQVIGDTAPERDDYSDAAWFEVFSGNLERALENARHATTGEDKDKETAPSFHTLAVVFAESGKTLEARQALFSSMDLRQRDQPDSDDWYVLGRIAETYGVRDAAIAAYSRVKESSQPGANANELAKRRLARLK